MTIDEAIKFCDEKSKNIKLKAEPQVFIQIEEWLEELNSYKLGECMNGCEHYDNCSNYIYSNGYTKGIEDFLEKIQWEYLNSCGIRQQEIDLLIAVSSQVAEQLKERSADNE